MSDDAGTGDRRGLPPEDEERGRYTEGDYGEGGAVAPEGGEPGHGEDDYTTGEYPEDGETTGDDPGAAVRPPEE